MKTNAEAKTGMDESYDRRTSSTKLNFDWNHFRKAEEDSQDEGMQIAFIYDLPRSESLPVSSTADKTRSFRRFASETSTVASVSNKDHSGSMTSAPNRMLTGLQGAKMHLFSRCHSADNLLPSILPTRHAMNTNSASMLPESLACGVPTSERASNLDINETGVPGGALSKPVPSARRFLPDDDEIMMSWHGGDDDTQLSTGCTPLAYLNKIAARLGL